MFTAIILHHMNISQLICPVCGWWACELFKLILLISAMLLWELLICATWCTWANIPMLKGGIAESKRMHMMPTLSKVEQPVITIPVAPHSQHLVVWTDCLMLAIFLVASYCGKYFALFWSWLEWLIFLCF